MTHSQLTDPYYRALLAREILVTRRAWKESHASPDTLRIAITAMETILRRLELTKWHGMNMLYGLYTADGERIEEFPY